MSKIIFLVGLPASGKSTYAKELFEKENAIILSSDKMRLELYGDESHQDNNIELFNEIHKRTKKYLNDGQNVIFDATNIATKKRMNALQNLDSIKNLQKEVYYFDTPFDECVQRDKDRERTVGKSVIDRMYRQLQIPTHSEGWDKIHLMHDEEVIAYKSARKLRRLFEDAINNKCDYEYFKHVFGLTEPFHKMFDLPHDSPYHCLSVSRHTYHVWEYVHQQSRELALRWAAVLHDIGKPYCKAFKEDSRYAQFLGHEFVGGQIANRLLYELGYDDSFILEVVELVQLHMRLMGAGDSEKAISKLRDFTGEDAFQKLKLLYEADLQAK